MKLSAVKAIESVDCRHFNGYKPCRKNDNCDRSCPHFSFVNEVIVVIHLGALGAVLRSTSLLRSLHRKHPHARLIWVTEKSAMPLLQENSLIDRVVSVDELIDIECLEFSTSYVIDKSPRAIGVSRRLKAHSRKGFRLHPINSAILPEDADAEYLWLLGLNDHEKFFVNNKPEQQLTAEALSLPYRRDSYILNLTESEKRKALDLRSQWSQGSLPIIGINTGCSKTLPAKKLSVETHRKICKELLSLGYSVVLLGGGPEDQQRNQEIAVGLDVIQSNTMGGIREGAIAMQATDVVLSGDSLGMHMAIALNKRIVAWFGPTCSHEIDLYELGQKIEAPVPCSPCWKKTCGFGDRMCFDQISVDVVVRALLKEVRILERHKTDFDTISLSSQSL